MSKAYVTEVERCGDCPAYKEGYCQITNTIVYGNVITPGCPLEDMDLEKRITDIKMNRFKKDGM